MMAKDIIKGMVIVGPHGYRLEFDKKEYGDTWVFKRVDDWGWDFLSQETLLRFEPEVISEPTSS